MGRRRSGGCLYAVIFFIALIISVVLLAVMFSSVKSTDGGTLLTEIMDKIGIGSGHDDTGGSADGAGEGAGRGEPSDPDRAETGEPDPSIADLPSTDTIRIEITQEKLRELLESAMEDSFPLTLDEVTISADSTLTFSGSAERDKFIEMLDGQGSALSALERMTLQLAPEEIAFSAKVGVSYDAPNGTVALAPQSLTVAGLSIPTSLLPASVVEMVNTALTDFFASYGRTPAGLTLYDGYMRIYFE